MPVKAREIICASCGKAALRFGPGAKYCKPCSEVAAEKRKSEWYGNNKDRQLKAQRKRAREMYPQVAQAVRIAGAERSTNENLAWEKHKPNLLWMVKICVPFAYSVSKNFIYGFSNWHVYKRKESRNYRDAITQSLKAAIKGRKIARNKLWISLFIEKPNHRGDAINVVDAVCDAIKDATGLDDRWYSIRHLDWKIAKRDPHLLIEIGQESTEDVQACSACGELLPYSDFHANKRNKYGITRVCRGCHKAGRDMLKAQNVTVSPLVGEG